MLRCSVFSRTTMWVAIIAALVGIAFLLWNATGRKSIAIGWITQSASVGVGWESIGLHTPWDGVVQVIVPPEHDRSVLGRLDAGRWAVVVGQKSHPAPGDDSIAACAIRTLPIRRQTVAVDPDHIARLLVGNHLIALVIGSGVLLVGVYLLRILSVVCYGVAGAAIGFHVAIVCSGLWGFPLSDDVLIGVSLLLCGAAVSHALVCHRMFSLLSRLILAGCLWFIFPPLSGPFCIAPAVSGWIARLSSLIFPPAGIALFAGAVFAEGLGVSGSAAYLILIATFLVSSAVWHMSNHRCRRTGAVPVDLLPGYAQPRLG